MCALAIVAIVSFVYWPGVHAFWGRDDFMQLAMARLIGSPWPLFTHDHFVVPGSVFRPLGFASMWLCQVLLGTAYAPNAMADLALHAGVSVALFCLLRQTRIAYPVALSCALLFALHPAVLGTALWWSARFDLLATLFVLLALHAGSAYREHQRVGALIGALAAALAAMLSKETGLIAVAALTLVWVRWACCEPLHRKRALRAVAWAWSCALFWLAWRALVLGTAASDLTGALPLGRAIAKGLFDWVQQAPGYLSFWTRLAPAQHIALGAALTLMAAATVATLTRRRARSSSPKYADLALCGACLLLLPALVQAPVAALNAAPLDAGVSAIEAAMQSRLYYLGIAGAVAMLAVVVAMLWNLATTRLRGVIAMSLTIAVLALASASREAAQAFAQRSLAISAVARDAVAAVAKLDLPGSGCHVVFLGIEPAPEWSSFVSMDSIIKALSPELARVEHCWFHTEVRTYFQLQAAPASMADAAPYAPFTADGRVIGWRTIGGLTIAYLRPPPVANAGVFARMKFLRYRNGRFDDVSADVAAGLVSVRLQ